MAEQKSERNGELLIKLTASDKLDSHLPQEGHTLTSASNSRGSIAHWSDARIVPFTDDSVEDFFLNGSDVGASTASLWVRS